MFEILKYTLPALIVLLCVVLVLRALLKEERQRRDYELLKSTSKDRLLLRLRAYERLTLLLERTTPEHVLSETDTSTLSVDQLEHHLLLVIREEYDHNLSQQVYVSQELWDKIGSSINQLGQFITVTRQQLPSDASVNDYAQVLLKAYRTNGIPPSEQTLLYLKDEVSRLL